MLIYTADKSQFIKHCDYDDIAEIVENKYYEATGKHVSPNEIKSWKSSLQEFVKVIRPDDIPSDMGVAVELHLPLSRKRIDVTLSGFSHENHKNVIIIELKQWETASLSPKEDMVTTYIGGAMRDHIHPSYQSYSYASQFHNFNEAVYNGQINIKSCAYLHNYSLNDAIVDPRFKQYLDKAPVFTKGRVERCKLTEFIKKYIKKGDSKTILYELDGAKIRLSKVLADSVSSMLKGNSEFTLIDEQKEVYEACRLAVLSSGKSSEKRVIIVQGGPGTGKSVVAINLLTNFIAHQKLGMYVSKNAAPRKVYEQKLVGPGMRRARFNGLFKSSGSFIDSESNQFDFLIVDEAHRLNEKSGLYATNGENQIKEIIRAAKCSIFFLDEDQRVSIKDIGNQKSILSFATEVGATIEQYTLESQFRCNGSDGYLAWLDHVLDIRQTANYQLSQKEYEFKVFDDVSEMHEHIINLNSSKNYRPNMARVVAGYCWKWKSKKDLNAFDITIGSYQRRWNLTQDGSLWIMAEKSVEQIGCIHTCQGLEVDYIGVIIGPDLMIRNGKVVVNPNARDSNDSTIKGYKAMMQCNPKETTTLIDSIIKNTYKTLMTRGMKGCFIYSQDHETRNYFKQRLSNQ